MLATSFDALTLLLLTRSLSRLLHSFRHYQSNIHLSLKAVEILSKIHRFLGFYNDHWFGQGLIHF